MKLWRAVLKKVQDDLDSYNGPAQPQGLWEHHTGSYGLRDHIDEVLYYVMQILDIENTAEDLENKGFEEKALVLAAVTHDVSKIQGDLSQEHSHNSAKVFSRIWKKLQKTHHETAEDKKIYEMANWLIKNHHINFTDPELFAKKLNNHSWFPYLLVLIAADLSSISESWISSKEY